VPFESDLLISYAHLDDQALSEGQSGWISNLHRLLRIRVGQLLGREPRIWRDPDLQGNDDFAAAIEEKLLKVATLVAVLSPRYVQSEWCTREVKEFCSACERGGLVRVGTRARVFKVVKTPVPLDRHPQELQPLLGYEFFVVDPQTGRPRELSQLFGAETERQFLTRLDDLAYDVSQLLGELDGAQAAASAAALAGAAAPAAPGAPGRGGAAKGTLYLAETSFDLRDEREAVKRDLVRNGYEVLPDRPLPLVAGELAAAVREQLARSTLAIHLVGRGYGVVPDGAVHSLVVLQHELAAERSAATGLRRLLWIPPGLAVEDPRQREFLDHLRTSPGVHERAELLEIPLEELKSAVHHQLEPPPAARKERPPAPAAGKITRIYLILDPQDLAAARRLEDDLFERGHEVVLPLFDGDEEEVRVEHEESLRTCDAVLLYYGEAGEPWLRRKLRELQRVAALGREQPLLARAIYLAPPPTPQKERLRTLEARVLREPPEGYRPEVLAPFLAALAVLGEGR
jgi:hypothetical protein